MAELRRALGPADRQRLDQYADQHPRDRAAHPAHRSAQPERRDARAARRAGRRARFVRRARQADVRPAGAGVHVRHDARVLVQVRARRLRPRLPAAAASTPASTTRRTTAPPRSASGSSARSTSTTCRCCPTSWRSCRRTTEGDANLLDKTLIIYGSPMANGNLHNHRNCPLILLGHGGGVLEGGAPRQGRRRHADGQRHADA